MHTTRTTGSLATPRPLVLTGEGCRCCRDLPPYLSCNRSADAECPVCGWQRHYTDVDDAPEVCPECGGIEEDEDAPTLCEELGALIAEADVVDARCADA